MSSQSAFSYLAVLTSSMILGRRLGRLEDISVLSADALRSLAIAITSSTSAIHKKKSC